MRQQNACSFPRACRAVSDSLFSAACLSLDGQQREAGRPRRSQELYELWQFAVRSRDIIAEGRD
jgi:hypothetical protein